MRRRARRSKQLWRFGVFALIAPNFTVAHTPSLQKESGFAKSMNDRAGIRKGGLKFSCGTPPATSSGSSCLLPAGHTKTGTAHAYLFLRYGLVFHDLHQQDVATVREHFLLDPEARTSQIRLADALFTWLREYMAVGVGRN